MANSEDKDDQKLREYIEIYKSLYLPSGETSDSTGNLVVSAPSIHPPLPSENDRRELRSGHQHLRRPHSTSTADTTTTSALLTPIAVSAMSNRDNDYRFPTPPPPSSTSQGQGPTPTQPPPATQGTSAMLTSTSSSTALASVPVMLPTPVRILPTTATVRTFSGEDPSYGPHEFLSLCEDVMRNSQIVQEEDKIAFVRSRLEPSSEATHLMTSTAFSHKDVINNYATFKANFIKMFGAGGQDTIIRQLHYTVDNWLTNAGTATVTSGTVGANKLASECLNVLKGSQWLNGEWMH